MGKIFCPDENIYHANGRSELVPSNSEHDITIRLNRLADELRATMLSRQRRGRGRPTRLGIRKNFYRSEIYLSPDAIRDLDQVAADMQRRTGTAISRSDLIRTAVDRYLHDVPESES